MSQQLMRIEAGQYTEELANYIFRNLSDKEADELDLERERSAVTGLAREPITIAVTLVLAGKFFGEAVGAAAAAVSATYTIGHLIEKWMDEKYNSIRTDQAIKIYAHNPELAKLLLQSVGRFSKVAVENEIQAPNEQK